MAVKISNTAHFKKGEKLPDGTIAKRGVVWNTKTGKRVTGTVVMSGSGVGAMSATKSYKGGRAVSAAKKTAAKKPAPATTRKPSPPAKKTGAPPAKKVDKINTRQARDRAMAGRPRGSAPSTAPAPRAASNVTPSNLTGFSVNKPGSIGSKGPFGGMQSARAEERRPAKGAVKQTMVGVSVWNGSAWVRAVKKNGKWVPA